MKSRLYVAAVLAGLATLVITIIVVVNFGRHDPSPPSLRDNPNPAIPGSIIYLDEDQCLRGVPASGGLSVELYCFSRNDYIARLYYIDSETVGLLRPDSRGEVLHILNLSTRAIRDTGIVTGSPTARSSGHVSPSGEEASADYEGRISIIKDGQRTTIAEFDTGGYGEPSPVTWSPDGNWLLLLYWGRSNQAELWIISRDGQTRGTLATGVSGYSASWFIEGVGTYPPLPDAYKP